MPVAPELKGSRRELATVLADGRWSTAYETARAMGKPTGAIFGLLRRMHTDGLLEADSETLTRGTQYRLTHKGSVALEEALAEEPAIGQLTADQWLLVVAHTDQTRLTDFQHVVARTTHSGGIGWGVGLGWGWLLAFDPGSEAFAVERAVAAFEEAGFRCRYAQAVVLLSGNEIRSRAATLTAERQRA
jgi:DNA-binding PadR family transcriptional regulator